MLDEPRLLAPPVEAGVGLLLLVLLPVAPAVGDPDVGYPEDVEELVATAVMSFGTISGVVPALDRLITPSADRTSGLAAKKVRVYLVQDKCHVRHERKAELTSHFQAYIGRTTEACHSCRCFHPNCQPRYCSPSPSECTEPLQSCSSSGGN